MRVNNLPLWIVLALVALVAVNLAYVSAGEFAVREGPRGSVEPLGSGLHLRVPLYHRLYVYDGTPVLLDGPIDVITKDSASFKLPVRIAGRASQGDVLTFHRSRSGREPRVFIEERLRAAVVSAARTFNADELLSPQIERHMGPLVSADLITRGIADDGLVVESPEPRVVFNAVVDYLRRGFHASARALAERSLQADPGQALYHAAMGEVLEAEKKKDEAEQMYLEALYQDPTALEPMSRLYLLYQTTQDPAKIMKLERLLVASLEKKKDSAIHHDWLGQVFMREGQYDKARMAFQTAIGLAPTEAPFRISLGGLDAKQGKLDDAIADFQKALELKPDHSLALFNLGTVYALKGEMDKALEYFQRAERAGPPNHTLLNSLAQVYEQKGQLDRAAQYLRQSLALRPDQADRRAMLKRIEAQIRKKA
jgi:tetratricopeptide (TPR) repeat protein